jgi:hypothetical protein
MDRRMVVGTGEFQLFDSRMGSGVGSPSPPRPIPRRSASHNGFGHLAVTRGQMETESLRLARRPPALDLQHALIERARRGDPSATMRCATPMSKGCTHSGAVSRRWTRR